MAIPIVLGPAGAQPQSIASLLSQLIAIATQQSPGLTANLPGTLIEDVSSTEVASVSLADAAWVELLNSITPYGANAFILNQLGQMLGVPLGQSSNTSVYVVFSGASSQAGFVIAKGFTVSDGTYQYTLPDGGVIGSSGSSLPLFAIATIPGSWVVPAGTVTQLVTGLPSTITLTVSNPSAGTPGGAAQSEGDYRADVLQANLAVSQGMATFLKTALRNVPGVQSRLVSVRQQTAGYEAIVGGNGDPYQIAYAIYSALFWIPGLVGSTIHITGITNANPGVATTDLNHGLTTGQTGVYIAGVMGMTLTGGPYTVTVISENTFSFGVNTTSAGAWTSGGVVTPNTRNVSPNLYDAPDTYSIPFVLPPLQTVTVGVTWNTTATNIVSNAAMQQAGAPALISYINSIPVGQPINLFELQEVFSAAVANIIPPPLLTRMVFAVSINGVSTSPASGTGIIAGDPESYFYAASNAVTIAQG